MTEQQAIITETQEFLQKYLGPVLFKDLDQTILKYLYHYLLSGICVDGESAYEQVLLLSHFYFYSI